MKNSLIHKSLLLLLIFVVSINTFSEEVHDPFEDINRITFNINDSLDNKIAKPVAVVYGDITPQFIQNRITRFFKNLAEIDTFINQALQGKPKLAINDFGRFAINSSIGLFGFFDVATKMGLEAHEEDFGQTLGVWGVPDGPYLMLPIIGPSNARDIMSRPISSFLSGTFAMTDTDVKLTLTALDALETRERYLDFEAMITGDRYTFVKDAYVQSRDYEIFDGEMTEDDFLEDMDDFLID
ncbi:MAG: VacJ family lipoprotein [Gammaproteobacteria bacterium TMED186]|nr:MAG: VacJ family lipoprotein [Gammaproteobacteria bacterium TMED186]